MSAASDSPTTARTPDRLPVHSVAQVRAHEQALFAAGVDPDALMYRAGEAVFDSLRRHWPAARQLAVVVGPGQNGGDGLVVARLAREAGLGVELVSWLPQPAFHGSAAVFWAQWRAVGGGPVLTTDAAALATADVIVDAAFGIGLSRPVAGEAAAILDAVNAAGSAGAGVIAVDVPSGVMADSGGLGDGAAVAVRADVTVTMLALKPGLLTGAGAAASGRIELMRLGQPEPDAASSIQLLQRAGGLPPRPVDSHKGRFGSLLVVAGNRGMSGAARMAAEGALRVGTGRVYVATHPDHAAVLNLGRPELMVHGVADERALLRLLGMVDAVVLGPGLGRDGWAMQMARCALKFDGPMLVDADGLRLLGRENRRHAPTVLTPHPGEAAELLDCDSATIQADRPAAAKQLAQRFGAVALLKGAGSLIAEPDEAVRICRRGDPALATAGTGDVLAGMAGGLLAQQASALTSSTALADRLAQAVCWHALAGESEAARAGGHGLAATDLLEPVRSLVNGRFDLPGLAPDGLAASTVVREWP